MTAPAQLRPVTRGRVLAGGMLLLAALAGVVGLAERLRHPPTVPPVVEPYDPGDPREEVQCPPEPIARSSDSPPLVASNDLYDCPHAYDGRTVRFEGEVVGAILDRGDGAWAQLNDDAYAGDLGPLPAHREFRGGNSGVGVHLPDHVAEEIQWVGGPAARGDVVTVIGTSHLSDPASGEASIIRATEGSVTARGEPIDHDALPDRRIAGILLAGLAAGMLVAERAVADRG